ncbi:MAG TPA: winged helix-turn-helix domain-containing protein [Burkholderiaceae bacterium]|jgi:predicted ATPase/DNA-binding winged helix-turn-helix (wHTH) protein
MNTTRSAGSLCFGPFELLPERRQLLERGEPVRLGSRALELLIALTERAGELMSRSELESRLWPSTVVEETSLRVHISALRKALGDGADGVRYIANVPGRGYSFVAPIERVGGTGESAEAANLALQQARTGHKLPGRLARVIGRDTVVEALAAALQSGRLASLVGAGGMGKTTVALLVAKRSLTAYADGVRFVDFSPLPAGSEVLPTLIDALDLPDRTDDPWSVVEDHLQGRHMLLVLDNCEHVVQSAAEAVETLMRLAPEVHVLATSREALDVRGERVLRLEGLQTAGEPEDLGIEQAQELPAVQLFVERASAAMAAFELRADNLKSVCEICRYLDGMPLAIELAAARVDALGIEGVASRLGHMFEVLTRGRRTAFPRHRTLLALLDWSHALLNESEQAVLRRLSLFRSSFTLELATSLCSHEALGALAVIEALMSLVAKSLVAVDKQGDEVQYRLLYTTRAYAEEKLAQSGEREAWRQRHAQVICDLLEAAHAGGAKPWRAEIAHMIEDLHMALDWTQGAQSSLEVSIRLVMDAFMFMQRGGVMRNMREPLEALFEKLRALPQPQPHLELRLRIALYFVVPTENSRYRTDGLTDRTIELVAEVGDAGDRLELQYALYADAIRRADYPATLTHANGIRQLTTTGPYAHLRVVLSDRLLVLALHHCGDHTQAWHLSQRVLACPADTPVETRFSTAIPYAISMGGMQARILWMTGFAEKAQAIYDSVMPLLADAVPVATCQLINLTGLALALWRGDLDAARKLQQVLQGPLAHAANPYWISWARMLERALEVRLSGEAPGEWPDPPDADREAELDMRATLVPEWVTARALERAETGLTDWCAPELLRASAEKLMAGGLQSDWPAAESLLDRAQKLASRQGALAWELRIANSRARLALARGRPEEGRQPLAEVLARFTEGQQDADPREARRLLALLG